MSEQKPPNPLKILLLLGLVGMVGMAGMGGLLYAGWKLVGESAREDPGIETEELTGVIIEDEEPPEPPGNILRKQQRDVEQWFGAVETQLAAAAGQKQETAYTVATKKVWPKRPFVSKSPISADRKIYQDSIGRKDVLVMVVYYADW